MAILASDPRVNKIKRMFKRGAATSKISKHYGVTANEKFWIIRNAKPVKCAGCDNKFYKTYWQDRKERKDVNKFYCSMECSNSHGNHYQVKQRIQQSRANDRHLVEGMAKIHWQARIKLKAMHAEMGKYRYRMSDEVYWLREERNNTRPMAVLQKLQDNGETHATRQWIYEVFREVRDAIVNDNPTVVW